MRVTYEKTIPDSAWSDYVIKINGKVTSAGYNMQEARAICEYLNKKSSQTAIKESFAKEE